MRGISGVLLVLGVASVSHAAPATFQSAVNGSSPVLYYQLDETSGSAVNHGSLGAAFDGTYFGTPVRGYATAGGDAGVYFDTSDDFIESLATAPAGLTGNPTFSVEIIVFIPQNAVALLWPPFFHWGSAEPQTGRSAWLSLQHDQNSLVFAGFYNSGLRTQNPVSLGTWHHVVWVREGGANHSQQGTTLFVDGANVPLVPDTDLLGPLVPDVTSTAFRINRGHDFTRYFQGALDELALYDRALSETEIAQHYAATEFPVGVATTFGGDVPDLDVGPNPFAQATEIRFRIAEAGPALLTVYDLAGRRIATLVDGYRPAGDFGARWDATTEGGRGLASGVYFIRLESGRQSVSRPVVLLR